MHPSYLNGISTLRHTVALLKKIYIGKKKDNNKICCYIEKGNGKERLDVDLELI